MHPVTVSMHYHAVSGLGVSSTRTREGSHHQARIVSGLRCHHGGCQWPTNLIPLCRIIIHAMSGIVSVDLCYERLVLCQSPHTRAFELPPHIILAPCFGITVWGRSLASPTQVPVPTVPQYQDLKALVATQLRPGPLMHRSMLLSLVMSWASLFLPRPR